MLIYCNERRISIPTDKSILSSIDIVDSTYTLEPFKNRNQIVVDEHGKEILDLSKSPNELGLNPDSTIYIINPHTPSKTPKVGIDNKKTIQGVN